MKLERIRIYGVLCFLLTAVTAGGRDKKMEMKPTFASCSVYIEAERGLTCDVRFRKAGEDRWRETFPLVYDTLRQEFRGSIVLLEEDTPYEVIAVLSRNGKASAEYNDGFRTWTSRPPIARTIRLSDLYDRGKGALQIAGLHGTPDGWIRIVGDCTVEAGKEADYALKFTDCRYVILDGAVVRGGYRQGVEILSDVSDLRILNCDISRWGRVGVTQNESGHYLDRDGNPINNDGGIRLDGARNVVVERCYIHDPNGWTNPWSGTVHMGPFAGRGYKMRHPKGPCGVFVVQNGGGFVLRYNDIVGSQRNRYNDPVEGWKNGFVEGGFYNDADIYGNLMAMGQDDGIELDGGQCNVRMYGNRFEQTYCGFSLAPNKKGPSYIFGNVVCNLGSSTGSSSAAVKNGGGLEHTVGRQFLFGNTMIFSGNGMRGVGYGSNDPAHKRELFHAMTRNNIFLSTRAPQREGKEGKGYSISDVHRLAENDFDYDMAGNTAVPDGRGAVEAAAGSEAHGVFAVPRFTDASRGVYTLRPDSPGIDRGIVIPNFQESFTGTAPDMGAFEQGASGLYPMRPLDIESDAYHIRMKADGTGTVRLRIGNIGGETEFVIQKSEDMDWLEVRPSDTLLRPGGMLTLTLKSRPAEGRQVGVFLIRLPDGLSVPVSVIAGEEEMKK